jgi:iron complex outermembrane receptor protein
MEIHMYRSLSGAALFAAAFGPVAYADDAPQTPPGIETIVVTASPLTTDPDKLATIVGQVDRTEILRAGGPNLADALASIPGVTGSSFAYGASRPVIRGFDANRVKVMEDGIGSFDVSEIGPDHGVPLDPLSAQRIEVVRGAATLRYGSQAIGGVVNALNNRVPLTLPDAPLSGEVTGSYGSVADTGQGSVMMDARAGDFALHGDAFIRRTGDYSTPGGVQGNSYFNGDGFSGGGSYFWDGNRAGAAVIHYDAKYGIPSDTTYIDMHQTKALFRSSFALDAGIAKSLTVDGGYGDYQHDERDPSGLSLSTFKDREWDARAEMLFGAFGPFSAMALGGQVQHRLFSALGDAQTYLLPTESTNGAGFMFLEAPVTDAIRFQVGGRVEHVAVDGTPASGTATSRGFTPVSGSAGLSITAAPNVQLGLTVSSAARAPSITEMFARGPHDGPGTYETGDPTLTIERANSVEATLHASTGPAHIEAALWGAKFKNYIYGQLTGRTCDEDGACAANTAEDFRELFYRQGNATFWGAEAKATVDVFEVTEGIFGVNVLADYVRATLDNAGNVPRIPPYHIGGGMFWNSDAVDASVTAKYAGAQTKVTVGETPTAGYVNLGAEIAWRPWKDHPKVELALVGNNLTDAIQRNAVSLNKDQVELPGRDLRVVLRAGF